MKRVFVWAAAFVAAGIVAINVWQAKQGALPSANPVSVKTYPVSKITFKSSVIASGVVIPSEEEKIYRDADMGEIEAVLVGEGQKVEPGTPLVRYRGEEIDKQLEDLNIARKRLELQLDDLQNKLEDLKKDLASGIRSLKPEDQPDKVMDETARKLRDLTQQRKVTALELESNERQNARLEEKRNKLSVVSRISGTVQNIRFDLQKGSSTSNEPLLHIVSDNYLVQGTLTEFDYVRVKPGLPVEVKPKVLTGKIWKGVIRSVGSIPVGDAASSDPSGKKDAVTSYPFTVELLEKSDELKYGYHVFIDIQTDSKGDRLAVPHQAVLNENGKESVLLVEKGKIRKKQVVTGDANDVWKEIVSGLSEGDTIVANPTLNMRDGTAVKTEERP